MGIHVKALTGIELCRRGCPDVKSALCGAPLWMLACAVSKKYFAWLCNPSAYSRDLSYNTRQVSARAGAEAAVSGLAVGLSESVWQSDCRSRSGSRTDTESDWPLPSGLVLDSSTQPHAGSGTRARIGVKRGRGPGSTPHFIFTVTPITSANNGAMPRTDTTHQHAGRGARQMAEPDADRARRKQMNRLCRTRRIVVDVRRDPTITSDLVSTHHHMDTAQREDVPVFSAMLAIATHSFLAGSNRSTELSGYRG